MPDNVLDAILQTLPRGWQAVYVYIGVNWTISLVQNKAGEQQAGLAATPSPERVAVQARFAPGLNRLEMADATELATLAHSPDSVASAVGFATLNALLHPAPEQLSSIDAGDWLQEHGRNKKVAMVGRFPFKEELDEVAEKLWVLELKPLPGEYSSEEASRILPQAEIVAITASTLINHTLEGLLKAVRPQTKVVLLGPTTPLTPVLFDYGVDLLCGVQVAELEPLLASIKQGVSFRHMQGLKRVSLARS
ncbi:MAG TPA: DUF364 domain-containing protein [Chloroflexia bacterium]|nr:DUF364 domain-containing protein [Chloroflexia bacterium]